MKERSIILLHKRRYKLFLYSFIALCVVTILIIILSFLNYEIDKSNPYVLFGIMVAPISGLAFFITLANCVSSINSSWIKWLGLTILVPFGFILSFVLMRTRMIKTISNLEKIYSSYE